MGPHEEAGPRPERLAATVTVADLPDGPQITIRYSDGHTVYLCVGPDSLVLRLHLGLDAPD